MGAEDRNRTPPAGITRRRTARSVIIVDRLARGGITLGGIAIIATVLGILVFILLETIPLLGGGQAEIESSADLPRAAAMPPLPEDLLRRHFWRPPAQIACDEYRELAFWIGGDPILHYLDPRDGRAMGEETLPGVEGARVTASDFDARTGLLTLATSDGLLLAGQLEFSAEYGEHGRSSHAAFHPDSVRALPGRGPILHLAARASDDQVVFAAVRVDSTGRSWFILRRETIETSLLGGDRRTVSTFDLSGEVGEPITALTAIQDGSEVFAGTATGKVHHFTVEKRNDPILDEIIDAGSGSAVTALGVLLGDISLVVATEDGDLASWFGVPEPHLDPGVRPLRRIHRFPTHPAPVTRLIPSSRNKGFVSADTRGTVRLQHNTTEKVLFTLPGDGTPIAAIALAPKSDGLLVMDADGGFRGYEVQAPHPEVSLKTLFGKVWFEGYEKPEWVWQSTGGSDEFEGKFSLVPLIFGTLKGTFYALLFAVPVALLAAIYTSQFMPERLKQVVKPTVEIMAALPSVVLGFLAGLYLAPRMETMVPATFLFLVLLPLVLAGGALLWEALPGSWTRKVPAGVELGILLPLVIGTFYVARWLGPGLEQMVFGGEFRTWLTESAGVRYDQRNSIIVGFAMGFAVIPIIFTICEDSFSAVPQHLISGSMACGASRWQTAMRIVLPAAGSGIFSAVMIGFGRAVGETMIVLMATGNTPIMDWSIFNGMRTLSANIAVEMPEAPYRGTLYRILFLSGLLLLVMTSIINTAAEVVRLRLKRKFGNY